MYNENQMMRQSDIHFLFVDNNTNDIFEISKKISRIPHHRTVQTVQCTRITFCPADRTFHGAHFF